MRIETKDEVGVSNAFLWGSVGVDGRGQPSGLIGRQLASTEIGEALGIQFVDAAKEWRESELTETPQPPVESPVTVAMDATLKFGTFG